MLIINYVYLKIMMFNRCLIKKKLDIEDENYEFQSEGILLIGLMLLIFLNQNNAN